jgi:pSer/pThr/pTyr-binding forkhead associated (FHA) protein
MLRRQNAREDPNMSDDGHTRKLDRATLNQSLFLARNQVSLVVIEGPGRGTEHLLSAPSLTFGRGPAVDLTFSDDAMSKQHAALELGADGYRLRDLGSTNGVSVNGSPVSAADLKHGDRIGAGEHVLQYVVEPKERVGTYVLGDD